MADLPADLRRLVNESVRRHGLGGIAVGVVRNGEPPIVACVGSANHAMQRCVDSDTVFRIASISKTLTAIGVMQLRDEGLLALDQPVNDHLKRIRIVVPPGAPEVTFRHLLTHTAGIGEQPRVSDLWRREAWGAGEPSAAPADLADLYGGTLRTEIAPGSKWAYANHGYAVLSQLVEDISGRPFDDYMRERVLRPLGMERSGFLRTEEIAAHLATGYHWVFGRFRPLKDYDVTLLGAGSVLSPLADMLEYASWLACPSRETGSGVLAAATLDEMMAPQFSIDARFPGMGLAFFRDHVGTHRVCGHDGNNPGFASALLVAPDDGLGVVVLTNTSTFAGAHVLATTVLRSALGVAAPSTARPGADVAPNPHLWSELTGIYAPDPGFLTNFRAWEMTSGEVQVYVRDRQLCVRALSLIPQLRRGLELRPLDESDPFLFAVDVEGLVVPIAFRVGTSGVVDTLCIGAPTNGTFRRRSPWRSSRRRLTAIAGVGAAVAATRLRSRRPQCIVR